jgi:hypothetical protein
MHMAMDPTQKIEMFADDDVPGSPKDGNASHDAENNTRFMLAMWKEVVAQRSHLKCSEMRMMLGILRHRRVFLLSLTLIIDRIGHLLEPEDGWRDP